VSGYLQSLFGDDVVDALLADRAHLQRMLDVEAALAEAQAAEGVIPAAAAPPIRAAATIAALDEAALAAGTARAGNPAIPLVEQLTAAVARTDPAAAAFVHWGATSQDIMDTAMVLAVQAAGTRILDRLDEAADGAARLAERYAGTPITGRTLLQSAAPVTFGLKAAGWLGGIERARDGLARALGDARVVQLGGAVGTLASLGEHGPAVLEEFATRLGLGVPDLPWHAARDRPAAVAAALGVVAGTLGKVARDVALLAQGEVAEVHEAVAPGRGRSSAMPNKRNPIGSAVAIAASLRVPGLVATVLAAMPQEHERGLGGWHAEWEVLPELLHLTAGSARAMAGVLGTLEVDAGRMQEAIGAGGGRIMAAAAAMALAPAVGRQAALEIVGRAVRRVDAGGTTLAAALRDDPEVTAHLAPADLEAALTPERDLGSASVLVARALARHEARRGARTAEAGTQTFVDRGVVTTPSGPEERRG
jgi:3-carboxy-cis,cis-muconate cycloisomerase